MHKRLKFRLNDDLTLKYLKNGEANGKERNEEDINVRLKNHQKQTKNQKKKGAKKGEHHQLLSHLFLTEKVDENEREYIFQ